MKHKAVWFSKTWHLNSFKVSVFLKKDRILLWKQQKCREKSTVSIFQVIVTTRARISWFVGKRPHQERNSISSRKLENLAACKLRLCSYICTVLSKKMKKGDKGVSH